MSLGALFNWYSGAASTVAVSVGLWLGVPEEWHLASKGYVNASSREIGRSLGKLEVTGMEQQLGQMEQRRDNARRQEFELGERQQKEPTADRALELLRVRDQLRELDYLIDKAKRDIEKTKADIAK